MSTRGQVLREVNTGRLILVDFRLDLARKVRTHFPS
jgi:hypothetical protein